ncbi:cold-inducible protein YdjO-related protein [Fictibacillus iocasae]|uniref:Cold-shock protein n=2 Tax=Fictibacillus TaxID=1329200 RepID=A0A235FEL7_9BACL|nr:cold-inducible protein YdjO-related protein [Fictibacillus aquaticus]OYD59215.1 cold-shock protein [Fictibacillus aquaticus]
MAFFSKQQAEPVPDVETKVWSCSSESCSCWMREDYSLHKTPDCPICKSEMKQEVRMLPELK